MTRSSLVDLKYHIFQYFNQCLMGINESVLNHNRDIAVINSFDACMWSRHYAHVYIVT